MKNKVLKMVFIIGVTSLLLAGVAGAQSSYPLTEEFDSSAGFTTTAPSNVFIQNGQAVWNVSQGPPPEQFLFRSIPEFQGDFRLTVLGQINSHSGNHIVRIGIGDAVGNGPNINFGFHGAGCPTQSYYIGARGVSLTAFETFCNFLGNWLFINPQTPYVAELTIEGGAVTLDVPGVGSDFGTSSYNGIFNTLWIGNEGGNSFPFAEGTLDYVIIEPLNQGPEEATLSNIADTYVRQGANDTNEGGSPFMRIQASGNNRALVLFDQAEIEALIGNGTLVSAVLQLDIVENADNWSSEGRTVDAHRLTVAWAEGNGKVAGLPNPERDRGTGAGATWRCAVDSDISDQGKDCEGATEWEMGKPKQPALHPWVETPTDTVLVTNGLLGQVEWDVTADVQAFLNGADNYGWLIRKTLEGQSGRVHFASREGDTGARLVITYIAAP